MKILFVCKSLPGKVVGGIQTHTWELSGHLARRGHSVTILTAGRLQAGVQKRYEGGREIIELPYFPGRKIPFWGILAEEWAFNTAANRWLRRRAGEFDLVHLQGRSGMYFPRPGLPVPVVTTFHGLITNENTYAGIRPRRWSPVWWHEQWVKRGERNALRYANTTIAVSAEMQRALETSYPGWCGPVVQVSNGVNIPEPPVPPIVTDSHLLLYVGRLHRVKGIYTLIEALKRLPASVRLVMIGNGPEEAALQQVIAREGLAGRVKMLGAQPAAEVSRWLFHCFALAVPSAYETQGIVVLEANAHAKPVVASATSGLLEVVTPGENGLLIPYGDAEALARAILFYYHNPEKALKMGKTGLEKMYHRYTWETIALQTERLYGETLARWEKQNRSARKAFAIAQMI